MVIEKFTFFDDIDATGESEVLTNIGLGSTLTIEVTGDTSTMALSIEGAVEDNNFDNWTDLAFTNASTGATATSITANGIYFVSVKGVTYIRMVVDSIAGGEVRAVGKLSN